MCIDYVLVSANEKINLKNVDIANYGMKIARSSENERYPP
jgi:hypothetical protein